MNKMPYLPFDDYIKKVGNTNVIAFSVIFVMQFECQKMISQSILLIFIAFIKIPNFPKSKNLTFFVTMKPRFSENFEE